MSLTNLQCKTAKPKEKPYRLAAGRGLYLEVATNGSKYWRMKYRIKAGDKYKEKRLAFGVYPEVSLKEAEEKCTEARKLLDQNIDPAQAKQAAKVAAEEKAQNTFEVIARQWHDTFKEKWTERHADTVLRRLERNIFPEIGKLPITDIKPATLIKVLKKMQKGGHYEPAHRVRQYCMRVFRYAIIHELAETNPAAEISMVLKPVVKSHYSCIEIKEIPELLDAIDRNDARLHTDTRQAIRLLMLTFVRTKELIEAKWDEFDLDNALWTIPPERMKMRNEHLVPLSRQALEILHDLKERNDKWEWVFPGHHSPRKHMSNNTILKGLERLGFKGKMTGHGFRALAMSTIKEKLGYRHEVIDRQLAHAPKSMVQRAYDRAQFLDERTVMIQEYADYLDKVSKKRRIMTKPKEENTERTIELSRSLENKKDSTIQKILSEWMLQHDRTSEEEADRLLTFFHAWYASRDCDIKDSRAIRDSAIKSGITKRIEKHVRNVLQSNAGTPDKTFELLKWGLYGSCAGSPDDKEQTIFNEIIQLDFEQTIKHGKVLSDNKMAEITPYSRKTINKYRNREDFIFSLKRQIEAFEFIVKRYDQ